MSFSGFPSAYAEECGPGVVAAMAQVSRTEAARLLWPLRQFWHDPERARPAGSGSFGTAEFAIADSLLRLGHGVEWWSQDGRLLADPESFSLYLRREAHDRAVTVHRHRKRAQSMGEESQRLGTPVPRRLTDWLARHLGGGWWIYMVTEGRDSHVLAALGDRVLTGDGETCASWLVRGAYRVFQQPKGRP